MALQAPRFLPASIITIILFGLLMPSARAEIPSDPPGKYSTSWLGNTYMDADGHKNVTEELADLCLSPNGRIFTAGYAETWGGGAEYKADSGGFISRYDRFESGFGDPVKCVAADAEFVFWGTPGKGILRAVHGGGGHGSYTTFIAEKIITGLFAKSGKLSWGQSPSLGSVPAVSHFTTHKGTFVTLRGLTPETRETPEMFRYLCSRAASSNTSPSSPSLGSVPAVSHFTTHKGTFVTLRGLTPERDVPILMFTGGFEQHFAVLTMPATQ